MDFEAIKNNEKTFEFSISGITSSYANALRRTAISAVKTFAIDSITVYENSSAIFDEYVAHRIGLIPLVSPSKGYSDTDEILFTLDATGPITVYSRDMETSDNEVKVASPNIPIIKLGKDQRLRVDGKAVLNAAMKHAKFQPGVVTYEQTGDESFKFYVESFGQMPPKEIINKACDIIKEEVSSISKALKKAK